MSTARIAYAAAARNDSPAMQSARDARLGFAAESIRRARISRTMMPTAARAAAAMNYAVYEARCMNRRALGMDTADLRIAPAASGI